MFGAAVRDGQTSEEVRGRLGIESISEVMRIDRLPWFGHVEREHEND